MRSPTLSGTNSCGQDSRSTAPSHRSRRSLRQSTAMFRIAPKPSVNLLQLPKTSGNHPRCCLDFATFAVFAPLSRAIQIPGRGGSVPAGFAVPNRVRPYSVVKDRESSGGESSHRPPPLCDATHLCARGRRRARPRIAQPVSYAAIENVFSTFELRQNGGHVCAHLCAQMRADAPACATKCHAASILIRRPLLSIPSQHFVTPLAFFVAFNRPARIRRPSNPRRFVRAGGAFL